MAALSKGSSNSEQTLATKLSSSKSNSQQVAQAQLPQSFSDPTLTEVVSLCSQLDLRIPFDTPHGQEELDRRLAAIMFIDIVGYTKFTPRNESLALQKLIELRKVLKSSFAQHAWKEIQTIGDGFLVEFPSALEAA